MDAFLSPSVRDFLDVDARDLGIFERLLFLGDDDIDGRYAAWRDACVACAFGSESVDPGVLRQAMRFGVPIVGFSDIEAAQIVEACGVTCDRADLTAAAALLFLVSTDRQLSARIVAEQRAELLRFRSAGQEELTSFRTEAERREQ
jgi:glycosyltransferase involved in cell wall biosynthesis